VRRYLETFSRHKIALTLPVIIALLVSVHLATSKPHKYESGMTIWFDTAAPNASSLSDPNLYTTPASQGQQVLQEFLATRQFLVNVGYRGPLASMLTSSPRPAHSPVVDNEIAGLLQRAFTVSAIGPQVAVVTLTGPNPAYLPATLNAVAAEYVNEISATLKTRTGASVQYYQTQVNAAQKALNQANTALSSYQAAHPSALPTTDAVYGQLVKTASDAQAGLAALQGNLQQANLALEDTESTASFHIIDPPQAAYRLSTKKHEIFTVIAGFAAGLIISLLALSALTSVDKTARRQEDIDGVAGMEVVASIRELPGRRLPGLRKAEP
jgi:uncharacterized protein involved in exopolysaccharide biosynthesis